MPDRWDEEAREAFIEDQLGVKEAADLARRAYQGGKEAGARAEVARLRRWEI